MDGACHEGRLASSARVPHLLAAILTLETTTCTVLRGGLSFPRFTCFRFFFVGLSRHGAPQSLRDSDRSTLSRECYGQKRREGTSQVRLERKSCKHAWNDEDVERGIATPGYLKGPEDPGSGSPLPVRGRASGLPLVAADGRPQTPHHWS